MKRRNYTILMIVGIVAMVIMPVATCWAGWVPIGNSMSGGAPDSDSDYEYGEGYDWHWGYNVSGGSRGADENGCWAEADMGYGAWVATYSWGGSVSASVPDGRWVKIYAESYYPNIPNMGYRYLDYVLDAYVSGCLQVSGYSVMAYPEYGSTYSWSEAYGEAEIGHNTEGGDDYGYGYVDGSQAAFAIGDTWWTVGGEATEDPGSPGVTEDYGKYYIGLSFTIDVYEYPEAPLDADDLSCPSSYTATAGIGVEVDAEASVNINEDCYGFSISYAEAYMDGYSLVDVDLYN